MPGHHPDVQRYPEQADHGIHYHHHLIGMPAKQESAIINVCLHDLFVKKLSAARIELGEQSYILESRGPVQTQRGLGQELTPTPAGLCKPLG